MTKKPTTWSEDFSESISSPRRTAVDGTLVEQHSIPEQIAADRYFATCEAVEKRSTRPFRLQFFNGSTTSGVR